MSIAATVEDFSTPRKPDWRGILNCVKDAIGADFGPMDGSLHKKQVGERLRQAREALGLTQAELARAYELDKTKLSHWERGVHYPDPLFLYQLASRHGVSFDWIYAGDLAGLRHSLAENLRAAAKASAVSD